VNVYVRFDFLSAAECEAAVGMFPASSRAKVNGAPMIRDSQTAFLSPQTTDQSALVTKVFNLLKRANDVSYGFELATHEPLQLAEYADGGRYDQHIDIGPGTAALRKLSVSVQLSGADDYEGGDLSIWGVGPVERLQGSAVVFPSYLVHEVTPVTRGVRRSLVGWAIGARPFR
jgi:PKHD-type hydroxylase